VVNNYRQNDYAPYLYHTADYGKNWERVVSESDVPGFILSFACDPLEPRLQFLGTEYGLYVTIDGGANWTKWTNGYPTVSTMDLVIHPREHDLVIGTFGRSAYVLDDIRPLRALATDFQSITSSNIYIVKPPEAYLADMKNAPGYYFTGDAYFQGDNRPWGARLSYFARVDESAGKEQKDTLVLEVRNPDGDLIRILKRVPENGLNRTGWSLDRKGVQLNFSAKASTRSSEPGGGGYVLPGTYKLALIFKGDTAQTSVEVKSDPRVDYDLRVMEKELARTDKMIAKMERLNEGLDRIRESKETFELVKKLLGENLSDEMVELIESVDQELKGLSKTLFRDETIQGIYNPPDALHTKLSGMGSVIRSTKPLTQNQLRKYDLYISLADEAIALMDGFHQGVWDSFRKAVEGEELKIFKGN
jgi:hypothetical protein